MDVFLENLPMLICLLSGILLLLLEAFMPGFGVLGISGLALSLVGIYLVWESYSFLAAVGVAVLIIAIIGIALSISLRSATKGALRNSALVLSATESPDDGYSAVEDTREFLGREGVTTTPLRPAGIADFDGVRLNVVSAGGFVKSDEKVRITLVEGNRIVVTKIEEA